MNSSQLGDPNKLLGSTKAASFISLMEILAMAKEILKLPYQPWHQQPARPKTWDTPWF